MWPELGKALENSKRTERLIAELLKNHNALGKKEIARQQDVILAEIDSAFEMIDKEIEEMKENLRNHRKQAVSKARFLRRHYRYI